MRSREYITEAYERHLLTVYRLCFTYLKNPSDTEDAVQNVFIKLMNREQEFESIEHEKAWLITCAANLCKDLLKSAYRKRTDFDLPDIADEKPSNPVHDEVLNAVLALPDKYKDTVYLHYYEGYKTDEISQLLDRPSSTVRSHLSEARALLRERLGGDTTHA